MKAIQWFLLAPCFWAASLFSALGAAPDTLDQWVDAAQETAGLASWSGKSLVQTDIEIVFGGKTIVDATFTFEANGPKSKMTSRDGTTVIFDGKTAWTTGEPDPQARFHVLTWPWFVVAPFKMKGEGITLSDLKRQTVRGKDHLTLRQTFARDMGDAPDDWYRFFIDPETKLIDWMEYIVTFGKTVEEANASPSVIRYTDFKEFDGVKLGTDYTFYHWNSATDQPDPEPKGVGTVKNVRFLPATAEDFAIPEGAREIPLP